jgi:hypothetical protein
MMISYAYLFLIKIILFFLKPCLPLFYDDKELSVVYWPVGLGHSQN